MGAGVSAPAPLISSDPNSLRLDVARHIITSIGKPLGAATPDDLFAAVALTARDRAIQRAIDTEARHHAARAKRVYYLSMEFLMGRLVANGLANLGLDEPMAEAVKALGFDLEEVLDREVDAALGNGGLGRLAACFLDSLATLDYPGWGYGLYYEFGIFRQEIDDGYQREHPDRWLGKTMPWAIERADEACSVPVNGRIVDATDRGGHYNPLWLDWKLLVGVPHDVLVPGWGGKTVNVLRLYAARASDEFDMSIFNEGDYIRAVDQKIRSETVSKVLYPSDAVKSGKELRLLQEYFFVACSLRDVFRRFQRDFGDLSELPRRVAIQMNDTHPALAVAELMRLLVDENDVPWEKAWALTTATLAFTNHTLLPEALERWPVPLLEALVPRHLQIVYEINRRFLDEAAIFSRTDPAMPGRVSLVEEGSPKQVRMANLAIVGSHSVNGVAALHSELIKTQLVPDFYRLFPERFNNKTNGVTPRRWLRQANPDLAALLTSRVGDDWVTDLERLRGVDPLADDAGFQADFARVKRRNKERLARVVAETARVTIDPDAAFDVHCKRIHEYKRQLLNVLHVVHQYLSIVEDGAVLPWPKAYLFAGKAAPSYRTAKEVIKLVHAVGERVNHDKRVKGQLSVAFLPDYRVTLAGALFPGADLSEQISTAGMEASGTGNMKFAMNGALTIGTLDGANIEIAGAVGSENVFIFGKTAPQIAALSVRGAYRPAEALARCPRLTRVLAALESPLFCPRDPGLFSWVRRVLVDEGDRYFLVADFDAYADAQERAGKEYAQPAVWWPKAIRNVARMGPFSSDRTIRQYAEEIWGLTPVR